MKTTGSLGIGFAVGLGLALVFGMAGCAATAGARTTAATVDCRVELDREVLLANAPQRAVVKVTLDAPRPPRPQARPPVNLAIVLDRSGSMSGSKIQKAREAAIEAVRRLGPRDRFSLVIYNHHVETLVPAQSAANVDWIESRIREITADGNTALFGGVSQGAAELRKNLDGRYVHRIILLSDGLANVGPSSPADLGRLGAALAKEHISVTTVGVGTDYNEDLMTQLSQNSDGNTYFVEDVPDLPRIFAAELGDVLNVVAKQVTIEITFPDGVRPLRIIGRDGRLSRDTVQIDLNQLYGGQEKYVLVEVEIPPAAERAVRDVAFARCSYENVFNQQRETARGQAQARFSGSQRDVVSSVNKKVHEELARNVIAEARDRAVELYDQNKPAEAVAALRRQKEELAQQGAQYGLTEDLQPQLQALEKDADKLDQEGMSKTTRKALRTESYQDRNQQQAQ